MNTSGAVIIQGKSADDTVILTKQITILESTSLKQFQGEIQLPNVTGETSTYLILNEDISSADIEKYSILSFGFDDETEGPDLVFEGTAKLQNDKFDYCDDMTLSQDSGGRGIPSLGIPNRTFQTDTDDSFMNYSILYKLKCGRTDITPDIYNGKGEKIIGKFNQEQE